MSTITKEQLSDDRLVKILSETQAEVTEHNSRCARGSVEVDARMFESMLVEIQLRRHLMEQQAAMLQGADGNSPDGWVACSERMPKLNNGQIWIYSPTRGVNLMFALSPSGTFYDTCDSEEDVTDATHWMPIKEPSPPQQEVRRELFVSSKGNNCSKHPDTQLINHPHLQTASIPPHPVKYCPKCEPGVLPLKAFRIPDEWIFGAHTNCLTISCSVKSDKKITFVNSSFVNCSEPEGDIQFINCTLPAEWEGKVNSIDCVFKAAPQQEVK